MSYRVYGLVLASNLPLPELAAVAAAASEEADVRFRRAPLSCLYPDPPEWFMHWRMPSGEPIPTVATGRSLQHALVRIDADRRESEDRAVEAELGLEAVHHVLRLAKAVTVPLVLDVNVGNPPARQCLSDRDGLIRRHHLVVEALEQGNRDVDLVDRVQR